MDKKPLTKFTVKFRFPNGNTGSASGELSKDMEGDPVGEAMKIVRRSFGNHPMEFTEVKCS